jgi:hypothetical protein
MARRADTVFSGFIFLNLLKRNTEHFAEARLTKVEREPSLAHPGADIDVDGVDASGRSFVRFGFFHSLFPRDDLEKAVTLGDDVPSRV